MDKYKIKIEDLFIIDEGIGKRKISLKELEKKVVLISGKCEDTSRVVQELEKRNIPYETTNSSKVCDDEYVIDLRGINLEY